MSFAASVTLPKVSTNESLITAVTSFLTTLPIADTWTATVPEPETPMAKVWMPAEEFDVRSRVEPPSMVAPLMLVSIVLVMTLADRATPTATFPEPETLKARESMLELSVAERLIAPSERTLSTPSPSLSMTARVLLVTTLPEREVITATEPEAAMPPVKPRISASLAAVMSRVAPLLTVEPEISVATLLVITLAPTRTDAATLPEAAMLSPRERICDWSVAVRSINPPLFTVEPPMISAAILLVITLPKPLAWTATLPEAATPTLTAMIPASERVVK